MKRRFVLNQQTMALHRFFCESCSQILVQNAGAKSFTGRRLWYLPNSIVSSQENWAVLPKNIKFSTSPSSSEPTVFYRWPTMRHFRFISRFKVYQVSTMLLLLPPMGWWYSTGVISGQTVIYALVSAVGTTGVLGVLSYYFTRVVGELALVGGKVRVSTLTFMGNRRELEYPLSSILPFADTNVGGAVQRLEVTGEKTQFLYSLRYGRVVNDRVMSRVLGISKH